IEAETLNLFIVETRHQYTVFNIKLCYQSIQKAWHQAALIGFRSILDIDVDELIRVFSDEFFECDSFRLLWTTVRVISFDITEVIAEVEGTQFIECHIADTARTV